MTAEHLAHALSASGLSGEAVAARAAQFERLLATLGRERTDYDEWDAWFVPGRIEVLGKHTDYGGGRSLICAAERGFSVVAGTAPRHASLDHGYRTRRVASARSGGAATGRQLGDVPDDRDQARCSTTFPR